MLCGTAGNAVAERMMPLEAAPGASLYASQPQLRRGVVVMTTIKPVRRDGPPLRQPGQVRRRQLTDLVGSGDRTGLFTLPFLTVGVSLNAAFPTLSAVGGPALALG